MDKNAKGPITTRGSRRQIAKRVFRYENTVLAVVLIAVTAAFGVITEGKSVARVNMANVLLQSSMRGVTAIGQAFVILTAGIDISVGGLGKFTSILGAGLMAQNWQNLIGHYMSPIAAIPIMLFTGAVIGAANGAAVSRIGMPALIVTLAMWQIVDGASFQTCGGSNFQYLPLSMTWIGQGNIAGVPVPVIIFIVVSAIAYFVLHFTPYGRSVYATGGNPVSAWLSGINVKRILFSVYVVSGFLAGLAGVIVTGRTMSASMRTLEGLELDSIAAATIGGVSLAGGRGSIIGVVIGVIIIGVINNGMSILGAGPALQGIAKGSIIFTAVAIDYLRRRG
jgi:putative xylitol transport system permease protein